MNAKEMGKTTYTSKPKKEYNNPDTEVERGNWIVFGVRTGER